MSQELHLFGICGLCIIISFCRGSPWPLGELDIYFLVRKKKKMFTNIPAQPVRASQPATSHMVHKLQGIISSCFIFIFCI